MPIYSAGAKLIGLHGLLCLVDGVKLGHVVHSYIDEVSLAFTACRSAIPDPDFYSECIQVSFDEHMKAVKEMETKASRTTSAKLRTKEKSKPKTSAKNMLTQKTVKSPAKKQTPVKAKSKTTNGSGKKRA